MNVRTAFVFLLCLAPLAAQVETARIIGSVRDQSGAVVPNAKVSLTSKETGRSSETTVRGDGSYESLPLRIGTWRVAVTSEGFKRAVRDGIVLQIQQTVVADFNLELGAVTQEIEITTTAPLLNVTEATQGQVIDNKKIVDMPLNGRDYIQLALLSGGVNQPAPGARTEGFSGSGMRASQNNYLLDGVDNNNAQIAAQGRQGEAVKPNVDAIQEFKVLTNAFSAEYSRATGAVVSVSLKSGTNALHGSVYEFLRNEKLDAKNFFDLPNQPRPPFKRNQYGFAVGGPIVRNKTFFFADYEWLKIRESRTVNNTIPTQQMVRGNFAELLPSAQIYDPASYNATTRTRQLFPGNIIPSTRFDPVGARLASLYPAPNKPDLTRNFLYNPADATNRDRWDIKIDHAINSFHTLTGRYSYQKDYEPSSADLPAPAYGGANARDISTTGYNVMLGYNYVIAPTVVLSSKISWNALLTNITPPPEVDRSLNAQLGIRGVDQFTAGMANIGITGYTAIGLGSTLPNRADSQNRQAISDLTWLKGRHSLKTGANLSWLQSHLANPNQALGVFSFDGSFTRNTLTTREGNAVADLLLGFPFQAQLSTPSYMNQRAPWYGFYVQDEWRVTSRLTLNLGLRYDLRMPWVETRNLWSNFDIDTNPARAQLVLARDGSRADRATITPDRNDFAPRFGFAYSVNPMTVVRGGYGVYYSQYEGMGGAQYLQTNPPFQYRAQIDTDRITPTLRLGDGIPPGTVNPRNATNIGTSSYQRDMRNGYSQQWNVNIQRQLPGQTVFEIGYFANKANKLMRRTEGNYALPGPGNLNPRRRYTSVLVPGDNVLVGPLANTFRHEATSNSNFHSLQTKIEKRFSSGIGLLGSYMWSKAISDGRGESAAGGVSNSLPQDPLNYRAERSLADEHRGHRFVASYNYDLPFGRGKKLMSGVGAIADGVFGGWSLGGITTLSTGRLLSLSVQGNPSNTGNPDRPDVAGNWRLDSSQRGLDHWFNTSAFARNAPFTYGNAGRNLIQGPGEVNFDLAVYKSFRVREGIRVQFRAEAFNLMNTPNFGVPNGQVGNPNFGTIGAASRPRNLQFGVKVIF
ncbi:MAG: carboxypeptidase regulatory-like domain-containing protein [Bryobacteraceae bacterium]|nr:carboxypeptidase regulatory-like domain-containing protein [Bryobacteraceae bacterium]